MSTESTGGTAAAPLLRVVAGRPTAEELAALVAVLAARPGQGTADTTDLPGSMSAWTDRARYVRAGRLGFGTRAGWRGSALPH